MKKQEKAQLIQTILSELFPDPPIPLNHTSPFTLLVAVVLSAQCQDARINQVTPALFERADTPKKMAELPLEEIELLIKTCGLTHFKAKALKTLSCQLLEKHGGEVPDTFEELEALPGVGHKTASVIMAQVFHKPAFPVDTHIERLARRWGLSKGKTALQVENDLKKLFRKESWNLLHLQMIYFGRKFCPAKAHDPSLCPICKHL